MVESKNFREVAIDLAGYKASVEHQFKYTNYGLMTLITILAAAGGTLYVQMADIKAATARVEEKIVAGNERLAKLEQLSTTAATVLSKLDQTNATTTAILNRIDTQVANLSSYSGPLMLSLSDAKVITDSLGLQKIPFGRETTKVRLGDVVSSDALKDFPESLLLKLPKLRGTKYMEDSGSVVIADSSGRVIAVVIPT